MRNIILLFLLASQLAIGQIIGVVASSGTTQSITNYVFDGTNDGIFTTDFDIYDADGGSPIIEYTWVIRAKITNTTDEGVIIGTGTDYAMYFRYDGTSFSNYLIDAGGAQFINDTYSADTNWHTYSCYYDDTNPWMRLLIDGVSIAISDKGTYTGAIASRLLQIGKRGTHTSSTFEGEMSDIQCYNRVLTLTEIVDLTADMTDLPTDHATSLLLNFAGNKTATTWTDEISGYEATAGSGITTN